MKTLPSTLLALALAFVLIGCEEVNLGTGQSKVVDNPTPAADAGVDLSTDPDSVEPGDGSATLTPAEAASCPVPAGKKNKIIRVSGDRPRGYLSTSDTVTLIITGNSPSFELHLKKAADGASTGLCVFARGNESKVEVEGDAKISAFVYEGRGNENRFELEVEEGGSLAKGKVDLRGNRNEAEIEYERGASVVCPVVTTQGNDNRVECGQED